MEQEDLAGPGPAQDVRDRDPVRALGVEGAAAERKGGHDAVALEGHRRVPLQHGGSLAA